MRTLRWLRRAVCAAALTLTLALAGCGDDDGTAADEAPGQMSPTTGGATNDVAPVDVTSAPVQGTTTP